MKVPPFIFIASPGARPLRKRITSWALTFLTSTMNSYPRYALVKLDAKLDWCRFNRSEARGGNKWKFNSHRKPSHYISFLGYESDKSDQNETKILILRLTGGESDHCCCLFYDNFNVKKIPPLKFDFFHLAAVRKKIVKNESRIHSMLPVGLPRRDINGPISKLCNLLQQNSVRMEIVT